MRCLPNIGAAQARQAAFPRERLQERLAALRKAVEGLPVARVGEGAEAQADAAAPLQGRPQGADWGLPAELPCGALNEVVAGHADRPAAFGFLFTLIALGLDNALDRGHAGFGLRAGPAVLVAARRALSDFGEPYGHGLAQLGLDVGRLILVETRTDKDALWAIEETLRSGARPAMVAGTLAGGLDLTSSRRLNLAAAPQRTPLVLLSGAGAAGTSAAAARWRIAAAPAARDRFGALAAPRWHVALERCRLGNCRGRPMNRPMNRPGAWLIEWNHVAHRFRVVAELADRPPAADAGLLRAG
jgi:protein ImuA